MNAEERLAFVITALESVGILCLVLGGHAVRFYGLARNTDDFDLHVAANVWDDLAGKLTGSPLFPDGPAVPGDSWRPDAFFPCRDRSSALHPLSQGKRPAKQGRNPKPAKQTVSGVAIRCPT